MNPQQVIPLAWSPIDQKFTYLVPIINTPAGANPPPPPNVQQQQQQPIYLAYMLPQSDSSTNFPSCSSAPTIIPMSSGTCPGNVAMTPSSQSVTSSKPECSLHSHPREQQTQEDNGNLSWDDDEIDVERIRLDVANHLRRSLRFGTPQLTKAAQTQNDEPCYMCYMYKMYNVMGFQKLASDGLLHGQIFFMMSQKVETYLENLVFQGMILPSPTQVRNSELEGEQVMACNGYAVWTGLAQMTDDPYCLIVRKSIVDGIIAERVLTGQPCPEGEPEKGLFLHRFRRPTHDDAVAGPSNQTRAPDKVQERPPMFRRPPPDHCVLCKANGESHQQCESHVIRDENGKVTCPVLRALVCPICKASGDIAHTLQYCPLNRDCRFTSLPLAIRRTATGVRKIARY